MSSYACVIVNVTQTVFRNKIHFLSSSCSLVKKKNWAETSFGVGPRKLQQICYFEEFVHLRIHLFIYSRTYCIVGLSDYMVTPGQFLSNFSDSIWDFVLFKGTFHPRRKIPSFTTVTFHRHLGEQIRSEFSLLDQFTLWYFQSTTLEKEISCFLLCHIFFVF